MKMNAYAAMIAMVAGVLITACGTSESNGGASANGAAASEKLDQFGRAYDRAKDTARYAEEEHIYNLNQLTFGGDNAEAYFSSDGKSLVFQAKNDDWGIECDQIFLMSPIAGVAAAPQMLSTGQGRTTCSYFMPGDQEVVYASTHVGDIACPPTPRSVDGKYVWPVYETFDIYTANFEGSLTGRLTDSPGYDAEATVAPDGSRIVFTSDRTGDLELYTMLPDGSDVKQITDSLGYDGGAFFSPDSKMLVYRSSRPKTAEDQKVYKDLLAKHVVQPSAMELYVCNVDGTDQRRVTNLGGANWAPFFHPDGKRIIFSSNHHVQDQGGRQFNLFSIKLDGTGLKQITFDKTFDAFPMFSPDGGRLVFSSNRFNGGGRATNLFIANWDGSGLE
ncbi:MAG: TolB family protein [Saprospiraceae bacterium]